MDLREFGSKTPKETLFKVEYTELKIENFKKFSKLKSGRDRRTSLILRILSSLENGGLTNAKNSMTLEWLTMLSGSIWMNLLIFKQIVEHLL